MVTVKQKDRFETFKEVSLGKIFYDYETAELWFKTDENGAYSVIDGIYENFSPDDCIEFVNVTIEWEYTMNEN